jgi:Zn-dependent protease with chaperone function
MSASSDSFSSRNLTQFPQIAVEAFQHPLDIKALQGLSSLRGIDLAFRWMSEGYWEQQERLKSISQRVRIGPKQAPDIYRKFQEAAAILDMERLPEIYVSTGSEVNAFAFGMEKYQIVLSSGLIEIMDEVELLAVIGHELGHIKCQHMLYMTMAYILKDFGLALLDQWTPFGLGKHLADPILYALLEWRRKAEYSCDRAALLVVQDPKVVARMLTKLAGGSRRVLPELNIEAILEQADDYDEGDGSWKNKWMKIKMTLEKTHPFPILRVREIMNWVESGEYERILNGDYLRKSEDALPEEEEDEVERPVFNQPVGLRCSDPACKQINPKDALYCARSGRLLRDGSFLVCGNCGKPVESDWHRCPFCAAHLTEAPKASGSGQDAA